MKKIKYIVLISILFLVGNLNVVASSLVKNKYLPLCTYENKYEYYDPSASKTKTKPYNLALFYNVKEGYFALGTLGGTIRLGTSEDVSISWEGKLEHLAHVHYIDSALNLETDSFVCPRQGFYDVGHGAFKEHCFSNNANYCKNKEAIGTKYVDSSHQKRTYNFTDAINSYFKNWSMGDITIDDFINGKYKNVDSVIKKMKNDFKNNYMGGYDVPTFMSNSNAYKNAVKSVRSNFNSMKSKWLDELSKKEASGKVSSAKANEIRKNLNAIDENLDEKVEDLTEDLKGDNKKTNLDYQNEINKNISFCTGNTLRAFQALGYMIFIAKVIIPLLLIIMGSIDLAKAVLNSNEKPNKEVLAKFAKRLAAALIVFLIPSVLDFAIGLVDGAKDAMENENTKVSSCTKCLFDPLGSECKAPENLTNE